MSERFARPDLLNHAISSTLIGTAFVAISGAASTGAWAAQAAPTVSTGAGVGATLPVVDSVILAAAADTPKIVTIDGTRWRKAPPSQVGKTGRAGSRIILDGELWLRADDTVFQSEPDPGQADSITVGPIPASASAQAPVREIVPELAAASASRTPMVETPEEAPEEIRARQRRLMVEARQRQAERFDAADARAEGVVRSREAARRAELAARLESIRRERQLAAAAVRDALAAQTALEQEAPETVSEGVYVQGMSASAMRLAPGQRNSGSTFSYVQLMPLSYDIGGPGVMVEGSTEVQQRFHLLARAGIADRYQEALVGAAFITPPAADRLTLMLSAGYEYGVFPLESANTGLTVDDASSGPFITAAGRLVLNPRFMIEGGVGYSSFHEGDPIGFGSGFFHVNEVLDLMSRVELGDQDSYGFGIRVNYWNRAWRPR